MQVLAVVLMLCSVALAVAAYRIGAVAMMKANIRDWARHNGYTLLRAWYRPWHQDIGIEVEDEKQRRWLGSAHLSPLCDAGIKVKLEDRPRPQ